MDTVTPSTYERLEERASRDYPASWIFKEDGPLIVGQFLELAEGHTEYGSSPIVVLRTKDGQERSVWLLHTVLRREFARIRPKPAEMVAVRCLGEKQGAGGQKYVAYRVEVDRDEKALDWDSLTADDPDVDESEDDWSPPTA